jgi:hypothetical protein
MILIDEVHGLSESLIGTILMLVSSTAQNRIIGCFAGGGVPSVTPGRAIGRHRQSCAFRDSCAVSPIG